MCCEISFEICKKSTVANRNHNKLVATTSNFGYSIMAEIVTIIGSLMSVDVFGTVTSAAANGTENRV